MEIYTDGSSRPHSSKAGGWAVILDNFSYYGHIPPSTTNNYCELIAVLIAMNICINSSNNDEVTIYSDSQYCVKGFNEWMHKWCDKSGVISGRPNSELWTYMYKIKNSMIFREKKIKLEWVKGHSDVLGNELADKYSNYGSDDVDTDEPNVKKFNKINLDTFIKISY